MRACSKPFSHKNCRVGRHTGASLSPAETARRRQNATYGTPHVAHPKIMSRKRHSTPFVFTKNFCLAARSGDAPAFYGHTRLPPLIHV